MRIIKNNSVKGQNMSKKDSSILVKCTKEEKKEFMEWCERHDVTASKKFRKWMKEAVQGIKK
jgi:hypothetical protein